MDDNKVTASDVLFGNVYQISEDMIQATYKLVEDTSKFENVFITLSQKLKSLNHNLEEHILKKKWSKGQDRKKVMAKVAQAKELITICEEYAASCRQTAENLIDITERFESNRKVRGIIQTLAKKIEDEMDQIQEKQLEQEETEEDEDITEEEGD